MKIRVWASLLESGDYMPLLKWLIFTVVSLFAFVLTWYYGLFQLLLDGDKSYIALFIVFLYGITSFHCLAQVVSISRELDRARRIREQLARGTNGYQLSGDNVVMGDGTLILPGKVADHIRSLIIKAHQSPGNPRLDQTLLLRNLADMLRTPLQFGIFMGDTVLKLGLLGTIIGFILMLLPIATIDISNQVTLKDSMQVMSDGMAVAMYTTLAGLVASILIKVQYYVLDDASKHLFSLTTSMTEVFVVSALEADSHGKP